MKTGFFTMDTVTEVLTAADLDAAKRIAYDCVNGCRARCTTQNAHKATADIAKAKTKHALALTISNYVLAHPSEGLKVMK